MTSPRSILLRGSRMQQLRLAAGLVLLAFVATHFLNHALGLAGIEAMERFQTWRYGVTRSVAGSAVLGMALLTHFALGLMKLAGRRTWRMPVWEAFQLVSGLLIPVLLAHHLVGMRGSATLFGTADFYRPSLVVMWPHMALQQTLLLIVVWTHACVGLHYWLRLAPRYGRASPWLLAVAVLLPALALAGFVAAGREVASLVPDAASREQLLRAHNWPDAAGMSLLDKVERWSLAVFAVTLAAAASLPAYRMLRDRRLPQVAVSYTNGPHVMGPIGATLLEISRRNHVPHAAVCGGRARCSTCRVRVEAGAGKLDQPHFAEAVTLGAIGAPSGVRLACQLHPHDAVTVTRLVTPGAAALGRTMGGMADDAAGVERRLAVMFLDLKGFTGLSEKRLPYDVVFLLNRFFGAIGAAIASEGGWIDKYMGDGLLAVFGREVGLEAGARAALRAAHRIDLALEALNSQLAAEGGGSIGVGIGIHAGPLVIGRIGHPDSAAITVIGATVNLASRLESLTREKNCQLIVSEALALAAGWPGTEYMSEEVTVRGQSEPVRVKLIPRARDIAMTAATGP